MPELIRTCIGNRRKAPSDYLRAACFRKPFFLGCPSNQSQEMAPEPLADLQGRGPQHRRHSQLHAPSRGSRSNRSTSARTLLWSARRMKLGSPSSRRWRWRGRRRAVPEPGSRRTWPWPQQRRGAVPARPLPKQRWRATRRSTGPACKKEVVLDANCGSVQDTA